GDPGFQHPGIALGAPVPLNPTHDVPTFRDVSVALQQVIARVIRTRFASRICSGHSSGAKLGAAIDFGRSAIGVDSVRTGGNHVVPYDPSSPRIFDGFVLSGLPYDSDVARADDAMPLSAPAFFIQGRGDERYQQTIRMAHELLSKSVPLNRAIRIYEVKGMTHITRDVVFEVPQSATGETLGCFVSAAFRNMLGTLQEGLEPPVSQIAGRLLDGALVIDQAGGFWTTVSPILEDPTIDTVQVDMLLTPRPIGPAETNRWQAVTAALRHVDDAITPPSIACRVGGYKVKFTAPDLTPFPPETLETLYGNFRGYSTRVSEVVERLKAARLYDDRVESARATAELSQGLFSR
ncbi:MAG: alpha/beta hydrolase domain-containing protein, partial [Isosphaeraceae bacterium]